MSNLDDQTLEILAGLNAAQPTTQQVDYSGFMQDFQPVLNDPNYFVPQQGLLQDTPVLDTLSDLDVMQQRPQVVTNMLDQYPTLESDFQRSFAVSPDTFNMNVYQRLPYDPNYWQSFVNQGGGTTGGGIDLGTVIGGGLLANKLLGDDGDDGGGTDGSTTTIDDGDDGGGTDGDVTTSTGVTLVNTGGTTTTSTNGSGTKTGVDLITNDDTDATTIDSNAITGVNLINTGNDDTSTTNDVGSTTGVDLITSGINNTGTTAIDGVTTKTGVTDTDLDSSKDAAIDTLITAADSGIRSGTISGADIDSAVNDIITSTSIANVSSALSSSLTNLGLNNISVADAAKGGTNLLTSTNSGLSVGQYIPSANQVGSGILDLSLTGSGMTGTSPYSIYGTNVDRPAGMIQIEGDVVDNAGNFITDFFNTELTSGIGNAGTYLNDVTNINVGEALSGIGGLLSLADMVDDANVGNTLGTAAGLSGFGLFGEAAQGIAPALGAGALIASLAGLGQPDPSNEAGFAQVDTNSNNVTPFGMEGDKFNQENVNQSTSIANAMNNVVSNITGNYGLKTEGDILVQTGERDPLNITFGDMSEEPTINNRLNYNTKEGDILNTTDDVSRFYYTGQVGNDGSALVDNIVKGTNLLSLKAVANDEDTINMKDFRLPAFSSDKVKNQYLDMGLDETSANALTNASRSGSAATSELLGGLLVANTTNQDLFLTEAEKTSLLEKGYTEEQLDEILYG